MNKSDGRWWYYENILCSEEFPQKLPLSALEAMRLPQVPPELKSILSVRWKNKNRFLAQNAGEAFLDQKRIPIIEIKLKGKDFGITEEFPYHEAYKEIEFFIETAKELL